jgi:hypothetical protein
MRHPPEPAPDSASIILARRWLGHGLTPGADETARIVAVERISSCVPAGLARWFGPYGSLALITRALHGAQALHPSLTTLSIKTSTVSRAPYLEGVAESARLHGVAAITDGVVVILATLTDLVSRLIGDDLAMRLLEQCVDDMNASSTNGTGPAGGEHPGVTQP